MFTNAGSRLLWGVVVLILLAGSVQAQQYIEGINDNLPPEPGWSASAGHEQAFRWEAQNTFDLTEIKWHSTPINSGTIRLRVDTGEKPGEILRQVPFSSQSTGWGGAPFDESYHIVAGKTYFVSMHSSNEYHDFLGEGGVHLTYYWTINGQENWNGPYTWAGHRMIKFYGFLIDCEAIKKFKLSCRKGRLKAKVKSSLPQGTQLTVKKGDEERTMVINRKGRGKVKWTKQSGRKEVSIVECPKHAKSVDCG